MRSPIYLHEIESPIPMETRINSAIDAAIELGDAEILKTFEVKFTNWATRVIKAQSNLLVGEARS